MSQSSLTTVAPRATEELPIAVVGAGPVGLAAAAHLTFLGRPTVVLEAARDVGAHVSAWAHVRMFTPWHLNIDVIAGEMLRSHGWSAPAADEYPTGREWIDRYLGPLAELEPIRSTLRLGSRVLAVSRLAAHKALDAGRAAKPFVLLVDHDGRQERVLARAVIDATGTWSNPGPLGADGLPAPGERRAAGRIRYGIPDVLGSERARYAGRATAVVGSGHSAQHVIRDLARLVRAVDDTRVTWIVRAATLDGEPQPAGAPVLPARERLVADARSVAADELVEMRHGFAVDGVESTDDGVTLHDQDRSAGPFDEVVAATGFRPDLTLLRELRTDLDPVHEATARLAPLIDPRVHSCTTVPVHGHGELSHPETGLYVVGMKSYGRAPTFLAHTGYRQVHSVVEHLTMSEGEPARGNGAGPIGGVCGDSPVSACTPFQEARASTGCAC